MKQNLKKLTLKSFLSALAAGITAAWAFIGHIPTTPEEWLKVLGIAIAPAITYIMATMGWGGTNIPPTPPETPENPNKP